MSLLGRLLVAFSADTAEFESDMGRAAHIMERDMERMITRATVAGELIGRALGAAANKIAQFAADTLKAGDELSKLSQRAGFTVERLSELRFAGDLADVSFSSLQTSLGFFNKALAEAQKEGTKTSELFRALGVDINQGPQAAFEQFARRIRELPDGETKVAAMRIAFGRAGDSLIPLIAGLDDATERLRRMGGVMSGQLAKDSERFNDQMKIMEQQLRVLLLPTLTGAAGGLASIAENMNKARERGELLKGTFVELNKVIAATLGSIVPGEMGERMEKWFAEMERRQNSRGASGSFGTPAGMDGPPLPEDMASRTACAVSGGKWQNGRCVYQRERTGGSRTSEGQRMLESLNRELSRTNSEGSKFIELSERIKSGELKFDTEAQKQAALDLAAQIDQQKDILKQQKELEEGLARNAEERSRIANQDIEALVRTRDAVLQLLDPMEKYRKQLEDIGKAQSAGFITERQAEGARAILRSTDELAKQDDVLKRLQLDEERIQNSRRVGAISEIEALTRTSQVREQVIQQMRAMAQAYEALAKAAGLETAAGRSFALKAEQARAEIEKLSMESDLLAQRFDKIFGDAFTDALADFMDGTKSAKDAFKSFADSVVKDINRMVAESLKNKLYESLGLKGNGGASIIGSFFASLFGGGPTANVNVAGTAMSLALDNVDSYASGTDYVPRDMLALIHKGEAVIPASENTRGRNANINITINGGETMSRKSAGQAAVMIGREVNRALSRDN